MYPISTVTEPADCVVGRDGGEGSGYGIVEQRQSARLGGPQRLFDLRPGLLDGLKSGE
jgi:hypothetical protein